MRCPALLGPILFAALPAAALAQDTFTPAAIERAKAVWVQNAMSSGPDHMDCITTLNAAMRTLYGKSNAELGLSSQIDRSMEGLRARGLASPRYDINFFDENGKKTIGITHPDRLQESVWDRLRTMANGEQGWSVFGLSLMDGYHSVALVLDQTDLSDPKVYWCDQWASNGGWREHTKESLDTNVENLTRSWWSDSKKPKCRTTLWRVKPRAGSGGGSAGALEAQLRPGQPTLNIRRVPTTVGNTPIGTARPADRFDVLGSGLDEQGKEWLKVRRRSDQLVGWMSKAYLTVRSLAN